MTMVSELSVCISTALPTASAAASSTVACTRPTVAFCYWFATSRVDGHALSLGKVLSLMGLLSE